MSNCARKTIDRDRVQRLKRAAKAGELVLTRYGVFETSQCSVCNTHHRVSLSIDSQGPCPGTEYGKKYYEQHKTEKKLIDSFPLNQQLQQQQQRRKTIPFGRNASMGTNQLLALREKAQKPRLKTHFKDEPEEEAVEQSDSAMFDAVNLPPIEHQQQIESETTSAPKRQKPTLSTYLGSELKLAADTEESRKDISFSLSGRRRHTVGGGTETCRPKTARGWHQEKGYIHGPHFTCSDFNQSSCIAQNITNNTSNNINSNNNNNNNMGTTSRALATAGSVTSMQSNEEEEEEGEEKVSVTWANIFSQASFSDGSETAAVATTTTATATAAVASESLQRRLWREMCMQEEEALRERLSKDKETYERIKKYVCFYSLL